MDPQELATRYIAVWTEADPGRRRTGIEQLWAESGRHVLEPPEEARAAATRLGIAGAAFEARGYDAIEQRVSTSYRDFVVEQGFTFRAAGDARRLQDVVMFTWEAVLDDNPAGSGVEFLVLDPDGRIAVDYMFPGR